MRYTIKVETGPSEREWTHITMNSPSDEDARLFAARLGKLLAAGEYEMTVEETRKV